MSTSADELQTAKALDVHVTDDALTVDLADGRTLSVPLTWYPRLLHGTAGERRNWHLSGDGAGIHWPDLDEDISIDGVLLGKRSGESQKSLRWWLEKRASPSRGDEGESAGEGMDEINADLDRIDWRGWQSLAEQSNHGGPAVYELRMVRGENNPVPIPRFLACDKNGLLSIGSTARMESRRKQFICDREKCYGHSEGNLLHLLIEHTTLSERFPRHRLEYRSCPVAGRAEAKLAEERLIKEYVREFGEAPPLNSVIPGRYGDWEV